MPGIVVCVDGSRHSQRSLEWAMKEAALRQVPLTVMAVHAVATSGWTGAGMSFPADQDISLPRQGSMATGSGALNSCRRCSVSSIMAFSFSASYRPVGFPAMVEECVHPKICK